MLIKSKTCFTEYYHLQPFRFFQDFLDEFNTQSKSDKGRSVIALSTDIYILKEIKFLKPGLNSGNVLLGSEFRFILFDDKTTQCYEEEDITFQLVSTTSNKLRDTNTLEVSERYIRVDRYFSLEFEWWVKKEFFVGASNLENGTYTCVFNQSLIEDSNSLGFFPVSKESNED